jgi:hypothetical protein
MPVITFFETQWNFYVPFLLWHAEALHFHVVCVTVSYISMSRWTLIISDFQRRPVWLIKLWIFVYSSLTCFRRIDHVYKDIINIFLETPITVSLT